MKRRDGRTVLVVDDDGDWRAVVAELLALEGFDVVTAGDGRAAVDSVRRARPDVVITDVEMPVMDGCELLATLRRIEGALPIVVMTGLDDPDAAARLSDAFRVIAKPTTPDVVLAVVNEALAHRHRRTCLGATDGQRRARWRRGAAVVASVGAAVAATVVIVAIRGAAA